MSAETRATFSATLNADDATWTRGRGWALATGLNAHTCYATTNPTSPRKPPALLGS